MQYYPPIGKINYSKLRGEHRKPRSREEINNIMKNVSYDFLSMLVGLIDGDGYIAITNDKGYVRIEIIISLDPNSKDEEMLHYIRKTMNIGRVNRHSSSVKYTIPKVAGLCPATRSIFPSSTISFHLFSYRRSSFSI